MIISASRRTDIPNYYSDWFYNRIKDGYVLVRNPVNMHQVSRVKLTPDVVDCIVFWTKNPAGMIDRLDEINEYNYYFQFTLNSYGKDIEPNIPSKNENVIETFIRLSEKIGTEKVIWRYDPILINDKYTINYHLHYFGKIAGKLKGCTEKCIISFIDLYRKTANNLKGLDIRTITDRDKIEIAQGFSKTAREFGFQIDTCAETIDLTNYNIGHAKCIDGKLIERIIGCKLNVEKDKGQRSGCGCAESIDIGMYNTCLNGCRYCYANYSEKTALKNLRGHNRYSALLCGTLTDNDRIYQRNAESYKDNRICMFQGLK